MSNYLDRPHRPSDAPMSQKNYVSAYAPGELRPRPQQPPQDSPELGALVNAGGTHQVQINSSYHDRALGFRQSTRDLWLGVTLASAGLVLAGWLLGPASGQWSWRWAAFIVTLLAVEALASGVVWIWQWRQWHYTGPDAIASRTADSRLQMAETWFYCEIDRIYGKREK